MRLKHKAKVLGESGVELAGRPCVQYATEHDAASHAAQEDQ